MKKFVWVVMGILMLGAAGTVDAKEAPQESAAKREEMKKKIEEKKKELNGSEWKVALTAGGKSEGDDVLTFQDNQVKSKFFADKGFPASNYTISMPEGSDEATWETMQTAPKGDVVFMRGEWKEKVMRGVISEQMDEGKASRDHNFASVEVETIAPSTEKPKEEAAPEEPAAAPSDGGVLVTPPVVDETTPAVAAFTPGTTEETPPKNKKNFA